ncbi:hypothetical protein Forpi1262_v018195 [Fusarium oxysporum f. sp. raphani]|uniref:Uncharacterized protein n=1 Tax=Fusarium oxysporum f. sp. raphani TaxID=96318 RepID=A0A8J5NTM3_FUSOX|nr:hypothetical protein Forpi1262_v018195 [Fusarium oxysporum f. sp. raphani]
MATRMGLLGVDPAVAASKAQEITPALQNATSSAAWSTFNWIVLMSLFYQQPGLAYPEYPPVLPIPGYVWLGAPNESANSVRQPLQSAYMGDTFPALYPEWHFYLSFWIQCYENLRRSYHFAEAIGRSLLSITLQRRDLSVDEARHIMQQFEENRLNSSSEDIRATFMAELNLSMMDPEEATVESLANKFEDIALFREFTSREDSVADGTVDLDETYA